MNYRKWIHLDSDGNPWGIVATEQLWANVYALKYNKPEKRMRPDFWRTLFAQAHEASLAFGADLIGIRVRLDYEPKLFQEILRGLGFEKRSGRLEYQCDIENLIRETGSPFIWKTMQELDWNLKKISEFTKEITKGALDIDPQEKVEDFVQDWLDHKEFTSGRDCVSIGFLNQEPCALIVAQINSGTGWSRISYMGLIPSYRGQGLGQWVHRHGFTMMRQQGGKLYHGGTHSENQPMRKLFEAHGCSLLYEMEEWSFSSKRGQHEP